MNVFVTGGPVLSEVNFIRYSIENHPDYRIINYDKLTYAGNLENLGVSRRIHSMFLEKAIYCDKQNFFAV